MRNSRDFELTVEPALTIVNFRVKGAKGQRSLGEDELAAANLKVVNAVTRDGQRWISETKVNGRSVIRMMVISYLTESRHLVALQKALTEAAEELSTSRK